MEIKFQNFRGIKKSDFLPIRPITLFVGENSSGKTSVQAALRYVLSLGGFGTSNSFNQPPFNLGNFDDIAYNTVGRLGGRAKFFSISVNRETGDIASKRILTSRNEKLPKEYNYKLEFNEWIGQPALKTLQFTADERQLFIDFVESSLSLKMADQDAPIEFRFATEMNEQLEQTRRNPALLAFLFSSLKSFSVLPRTTGDAAPNYFAGSLSEKQIAQLEKSRDLISVAQYAFFDQTANSERSVVAFSPIRTEPRRVYEVLDARASPSGTHVPIRLAQSKIESPEKWKSRRAYLVKFGKDSGLYNNVDIRRLGATQTDPFQLLITLSGNKRNIMDVGYGVSQVLPLLYEMSESEIPKTILMQQPEVHLHPRAQAEIGSLIVSAHNDFKHNFVVETHSDFIIDRIRNNIRMKMLPLSDVALLYFELKGNEIVIHEIKMDEAANIIDAPASYREFFYREEKSLLGI